MEKKIVIAGGSGIVGKALTRTCLKKGYTVTVIGRKLPKQKDTRVTTVTWDDPDTLLSVCEGAYGIINLAGAPIIGKRWTEAYKNQILESRLQATRTLVNTMKKLTQKPNVFISGSAIGYYGIYPAATPYSEEANPGTDFLAKVCKKWEEVALQAAEAGVRTVCIRIAIILSSDGALPRIVTPFRYLVGGPIGTGKQYFPWIHLEDEVGCILFAVENTAVTGPINAVAPELVTNQDVAKAIGKVLHKPALIPVPPFALQLFFGEAAQVLTNGVAVSAKKILDLGYTYNYPTLDKALSSLLSNKQIYA